MERIQKILAHGGIASRRAAEQLIKAGRVRVNGRVVTELGAKADERRDKVEVDGKRVVSEDLVYIVVHKPRGVVSTMSDPEGRPTVKELLGGLEGRVYPVGRLDFATSGVLLATNDGELADGLLHPRKTVPKTYVLKVKGVMKPEDISVWCKGVRLEDGMTLPADAKLLRHETDKTWLELTIREGRNQQIRRMGEATRFPVMRLARVAFAEISAEGLAPGRWRHLTRDELIALKKTYGVPRSIPSGVSATPNASKSVQRTMPTVRRGAAGRTQRGFGSEDHGGPGADARAGAEKPKENWGDRSRQKAARAAEVRSERSSGTGSRERTGARSRERTPGAGSRERSSGPGSRERSSGAGSRERSSGTGSRERSSGAGSRERSSGTGSRERSSGAPQTTGPRYGGGSPGRRSYEVKEDWGGGSGRGATPNRESSNDAPRGDVGGGRLGRTRTTGTGGGIGSKEPAPRVKGRRGS